MKVEIEDLFLLFVIWEIEVVMVDLVWNGA